MMARQVFRLRLAQLISMFSRQVPVKAFSMAISKSFSLVPETIFHPFVNVLKFIHYAQVALPIFKIHQIF